MGRSISSERHEKIQWLRRERRLCRHANADGSTCIVRATVAVDETYEDFNPDGSVRNTPHVARAEYCMRHWRSILRGITRRGEISETKHTGTVCNVYRDGTKQCTTYHFTTFRALD